MLDVRRAVPALALAAAAAAQDVDPAAELARLVDLTSAAARQREAVRLARRGDVTLDGWLAAAAAFGSFGPRSPGTRCEEVELTLATGEVERTELWLTVPASYDPAVPAPLLLLGHGTGGSGRGMHHLFADVAERTGMVVLAPSEAGANEGYAFSPRERAAALAAVRWVRRQINVDERRLFVAGISRGGHLAWDLALRHPDLFAGIAPMIGGPRLNVARGQNNLRYLANVRDLPIRDLQGARDDPGLVFNVRLAFARLQAIGARDAVLHEFPDLGHAFDATAVDWPAFFANRRPPAPLQVTRAFARAGEGRAFWLEVVAAERDVQEEFTPRIDADEWKRLEGDADAQRRFLDEQAARRTATATATRDGGNRFTVRGERVRRGRLLLTADMFDPGTPVEVDFDGRRIRRTLRPSATVLLTEFAERFDRTFLPVAELAFP